jgi:hypothetical protein
MNAFRSRRAEDIGSIKIDDYSFWTWMGWGETSYKLVTWASQHSGGREIKVGWDYKPPLYSPNNVTMADMHAIRNVSDQNQMQTFLADLVQERKLDYIIISKNTANRHFALNELLRHNRDKAIYVDRQGGIEYGWLFRPGDLLTQ